MRGLVVAFFFSLLSAPLVVSATILGNIGYDTTFDADGSLSAIQNLGNGSFSNGERVTGVDIRIAAPLGGLFRPEIRSFLATSDMSTVVEAAYQPSAGGENVFHFDLPTPFVPNPEECYVLMFYQFSSALNTTFYGWSNNQYSASTTGCHPQYASHDINTGLQNPALNGHGLVDYSFQIYTEPIQTPPSISNLQQFRQFGVDEIAEGATFVGNAAVFKADITDADSAQVKLEIELKPIDVPFDGANTVLSDLSAPGVVELAHDELIPKDNHYQSGGNVESFHWRARAVDAERNMSEWVEYPSTSNTDFTAKVVPLWTQVESEFPSLELTRQWFDVDYANGSANEPGDCGRSIAQCGCAITSALMIANYYGVISNREDGTISPLDFNNWLLNNNVVFAHDGTFTWAPLETYTGGRIRYIANERWDIPDDASYQNSSGDFARLNSYVANAENPRPVISKSSKDKPHGGITRLHFFVIDTKIGSNYTIRDPYWFETKTLNDSTGVTNKIRRYEGGFDGLRIYEPTGGVAYTPRMSHILGSPAELLLTDAQGRRLGKDPRTGQSFNEIPGGQYFLEDRISNPDENAPNVVSRERNKVLEIENPLDGGFTLQVIGTGTGDFSLTSTFSDIQGEVTGGTTHASTSQNVVSVFTGTYNATSSETSIIEAQKSPLQLFSELKQVTQAASITPNKLKLAIQTSIVAAEKLYKANKITLTKITLRALKELIKSKKGKGILPSDAERTIVLIDEILARL